MSRAIYVTVSSGDALALCRKHKIDVSAAEDLPAGGARVVLKSAEATAHMTAAFGKSALTSPMRRFPLMTRRR